MLESPGGEWNGRPKRFMGLKGFLKMIYRERDKGEQLPGI